MKKFLLILLAISALLISCSAPGADSKEAYSDVSIGTYIVKSRTIAPSDVTSPGYYSATLSNSDSVYTAESADGTLHFSNVFIGDYKISVFGFDRKDGMLVWKSSGEDTIRVSAKGENKASVAMSLVDTEGTGTVKVTLDWAEAVSTAGLVQDAYEASAFSFELVEISEDGEKIAYPIVSAEYKATEYTYVNDSVHASSGFTGYFNIYYEKDGKMFLLMQSASAVFQVYAGQTSVPDDSDAELFVITASNMPDYANPSDFSLSYGKANPETSITVTWDDRKYEEVYISCSNGESVTVDASSLSYTFENLEKATPYTFSFRAKTGLGKETREITKSLSTKVFVSSISYDEGLLPDSYITSGSSFNLSAAVYPSNATVQKVLWETSDPDVLEAVSSSDSSAVFYAKKPGMVTIKVTSYDKGIDGSTIEYSSEKAVSVHLSSPSAPEIIAEDNEISKDIIVSWSSVQYASSYELYRNGELYKSIDECEYRDSAIMAGSSYAYSVKATNNDLITDGFDPSSEMSSLSESLTPVVPTITLITPVISNMKLEISAGEEIGKGAITVTPDDPVIMNIPEPIDGAAEYAWFINGILKKASSDFAEVNAITLSSDMPEVQDYDKDANSIMLRVKDSDGRYHSASAYFRVILVKDTGVEISMDDYYPTTVSSLRLNASVLPSDATMRTLSYSSSADDIASIDSDGLITVKRYGTVVFTATSSSGASESKSIRFYDPITDAVALLEIVNADLYEALHNADSQYKGDWWQVSSETYSANGYTIKTPSGTSQRTGSIAISSHPIASDEYGDFSISTSSDIAVWAQNKGAAGYLGTDPLCYVGYNNTGSIVVTLPYDQGKATIGFNSVKVCDGKSGSFTVSMPGQEAVTISYDDSITPFF